VIDILKNEVGNEESCCRINPVVVVQLAVGVIAQAQQPQKVPRIGYLSNTDQAGESARAEAIRLALRERGYKEGQNITFEYRYGLGRYEMPTVSRGYSLR
jgi:hypothetical protein